LEDICCSGAADVPEAAGWRWPSSLHAARQSKAATAVHIFEFMPPPLVSRRHRKDRARAVYGLNLG
jgi:hypothetical protein